LRAGVPTAIREIARLASMLGWADSITSKRGRTGSAARKFIQATLTRSPKPFTCAFSNAERAARGLISSAKTSAAPARAAARAKMPDPVPISATDLPLRSSPSRNFAKYSLLRKERGWKTVGRTRRRKPAAWVVRMVWRLRMR